MKEAIDNKKITTFMKNKTCLSIDGRLTNED